MLVLPALVASLATEAHTKDSALADRDADVVSGTKPDRGTKDAPVDGLDGKPHAGPFVYDTKERVKLESKVEDLSSSSSSSRFSDELDKARDSGFEIPDRVDSVMTDREGHAKGKDSLDGTEGGISTKERNKVKSGSEKEEKKPEAPKEVSEHRELEKEKVLKAAKKDASDLKAPGKAAMAKGEKGIGGLEVSRMI